MLIPKNNANQMRTRILVKIVEKFLQGRFADADRIPLELRPKGGEVSRCCIYKDRAILKYRCMASMGFAPEDETDELTSLKEYGERALARSEHAVNKLSVITDACSGCIRSRYLVTDACRGCFAKPCQVNCPKQAITIVNGRSTIDPDKCISCGACVYQCPFGAITDKSYIINVVDILKKSAQNKKFKVFAVVAPSVSSQFTYAKLGQVVTGLKELGFHTVVEAALGADMVADAESKELAEKGFLTSSCCPAFVDYIEKNFKDLVPFVSHNLSPMATIAKYLKENEAPCKVVFIGPCTAKKAEVQKEEVKPYVDVAMTFEELQALFDSRDIDLTTLPEGVLDNASYFGRIFARCGGLADAVREGLKEHGSDFELKPCSCDGIESCKIALLQKSKGRLDANFIEGMACEGGCIGGPACLSHSSKNAAQVDAYGRSSMEQTISDAISVLQLNGTANH